MPLVFTFSAPGRERFECAVQCEQCTATSAGGARCRNRACIGVPKCWVHLLKDHSLRIKASTVPGAGKGVFAMKRGVGANAVVFKANDKITDYYGERIDARTLTSRYGEHTAPYGAQIGTAAKYENGACRRGVGTLFNHGSNPNARLAYRTQRGGAVLIKATRPIRNNQEILVSYGDEYEMTEPGVRHRTVRRRR